MTPDLREYAAASVEIVLSALSLGHVGGMQTYVLTTAPQLERLGHEVTLYAPELGATADLATARGLRVARSEGELPSSCDAVIAQDAVTALTMAELYPDALRAIVVHSAEFDVHLPPGIDGAVSCAVVMNDAVMRRLRAMAKQIPVARLRQPIDSERQYPVGVARERPKRVLMLGNYLDGPGTEAFARVCERAGLFCHQVGLYGEALPDPVDAIARADIVIGQGRSVLDAMACGRAAWVYGPAAGDGWVTPTSYPAFEADGFRGRATDAVLDADSFGRALAEYRSSMGGANRRLVTLHHSPYEHAIELVEVLQGAPRGRAAHGPLRELARLVRTQYEAQSSIAAVSRTLHWANEDREQLRAENARLMRELAELDRRLQELVGTRRWRAVSFAARPLDVVRRAIRRRSER